MEHVNHRAGDERQQPPPEGSASGSGTDAASADGNMTSLTTYDTSVLDHNAVDDLRTPSHIAHQTSGNEIYANVSRDLGSNVIGAHSDGRDDDGGQDIVLYEPRLSTLQGTGLFATSTIGRGELMLSEMPLFRIYWRVDQTGRPSIDNAIDAFRNLDENDTMEL